ncbi:MAG: HAMP domain-containing protein [Candidatus Eisenbacteria bacterium]|nr:HAMP domain-containing protein [Candidatus Eisenbacteria bacterium]
MTLRRRLLFTFLGLAVVPIAAVGTLAAYGAFRFAEGRARQELGRQLETLSDLVDREVRVEELSLAAMAEEWQEGEQRPRFRLGEWLALRPEVLERLRQPQGVASRFLVFDPAARGWSALEGYMMPTGIGLRHGAVAPGSLEAAYRGWLAPGGEMRPITARRATGGVLAIAIPVGSPGGARGLIVEEVSVEALLRHLLGQPAFQSLESGFAAAGAGRQGSWSFLFHSDPTLIGLPVAQAGWPAAAARLLAGPGRSPRWRFARGGDRLYATGAQAQTGWLLGASMSLAPMLEPLEGSVRAGALMLGLMALLVWAAILLVTRGIGRAVEEIAVGTGAIARGDLQRAIRLGGDDEFGVIAAHVNQMARELVITAESRSIAQLSARLTHDLKGVASQMNLLLYNLEKHYDDAEFRAEFVGLMRGLTGQVESLVLRLRRGGVERPPQWERGELDALVREAVAGPARARPGVAVRLELAGGEIVTDREFLREAVENVVTNGLEAIGERGTLTVRTGALAAARAAGDGPTHFVEVEDTGPGMSREFIEQELFRPFVTTKVRGIGLGMYQVRESMSRLGGTVAVESRVGVGTKVRLEIGAPAEKPA